MDVLRQLETSGLEVVDLSNMSVANPGLFSEVRLMALRELDLSENLIATVPAASFGNIRSLRKLDISGNLLTALDAGFEDLVNLVELNISRCRSAPVLKFSRSSFSSILFLLLLRRPFFLSTLK